MKTNLVIDEMESPSDAELVARVLGGSRNAYGLIVERYQRLLCSLAYAGLGSIGDSEDVAQDTFVEGWRKLRTLKEPEKLRSWLCGILRFKVSHRRRSESRRPMGHSEALDEVAEIEAETESAEEFTMREEEHELLWTALEKIPEAYREPLVLYYREHRSVEHVACELDLSESAVKQRLSRGRKMLKERMMTFVEDALTRSTPGRVFTASVLAALPTLAPSAKAAGMGAIAAKAGSVAKWAGIAAFLASVSGFISGFFALRMNLDQARTAEERREVVKTTLKFFGLAVVFVVALLLLYWGALTWYENRGYFAVASQVAVLAFVVGMPIATARMLNGMARLRSRERERHPELFRGEDGKAGGAKKEYRSRAKLFGVPLLHVKFAMAEVGETPAFAWIALGDKAYGLFFALGGFAIAPVSVGIVSAGLVTCSCVGFGLIGMGTVGVGYLAIGAVAIGVNAFASLSALGWETAAGGAFVIARDAAVGSIAFAEHVNDERAAELAMLSQAQQNQTWILLCMAGLVIVPMFLWSKAARRRMGGRKVKAS